MRLATWNIQHGRSAAGGVDVAALGVACAALDSAVLGLQEVDVSVARSHRADLAAEMGEACGLDWVFGPATTLADGGRYGNALLVAGAIHDAAVEPLPAWPGAEPRCALVAQAEVEGLGPVSAAVCHLGLLPGEAETQLATAVDLLARRPPPRLLLGDCNLGPEAVAPLVERAGLVLMGGPATFPAARPVHRIDHIAVGGLEVAGDVHVPTAPVSDHRALVVTVAAPGPSSRRVRPPPRTPPPRW